MALDEFTGQSAVSMGGRSARSVFQDRFSKAWRFTQANAARDHSFVNAFAEMLTNLRHDLIAKIGSTVEHCHDDAR
jgi:hypothetical protein